MTTTIPLPPFLPEFAPRWPGDTGSYTAEQMRAYATTARADLEAEVKRLREALRLIDSMCAAPPNFSDATIQEVARSAFKETP